MDFHDLSIKSETDKAAVVLVKTLMEDHLPVAIHYQDQAQIRFGNHTARHGLHFKFFGWFFRVIIHRIPGSPVIA